MTADRLTICESVIDQLRDRSLGIPTEAIQVAREHREEIVPSLIHLIEEANHRASTGQYSSNDAQLYAAYLLAEFRDRSAWSAFKTTLRLPGEWLDELYGDAVTQDFGFIISTLAGSLLNELEQIISDTSVDFYVRWAAIEALAFAAKDSRLTREDLLQRLKCLMEQSLSQRDEAAVPLAMLLVDLGASELWPLVEKAFELGLLKPTDMKFEEAKSDILRGESAYADAMDRLRVWTDCVQQMETWMPDIDENLSSFDDEFELTDEPDDVQLDSEQLGQRLAIGFRQLGIGDVDEGDLNGTFRNPCQKIGRNDSCPCNSGKKYKNCCAKTKL